MKTVSGPFDTHLQQETTSLTTCWKLKRTDGVIIAATSLDINIPFDLGDGDGELTYLAATGYNRSAMENAADFSIGNMDIQGFIESNVINKEDIRAELYDFAEVKIFQLNWKDTTQGSLKMQRGYLGRIKIKDTTFVAEFRDLMDLYSAEIGDIVTEECIVDLFDAKCKVRETPPDWNPSTAYTVSDANDANVGSYVSDGVASNLVLEDGSGNLLLEDGFSFLLESAGSDRIFRCTVGGTSDATPPSWNLTIGGTTVETGGVEWVTLQANKITAVVDSVTNRSVFTLNATPATDAPDIFFREGTILFTTGLNNALTLRREIKDWDLATRTVTLWRPMPFDIVVGDILDMSAGCNKSTATCSGTFFNIFNSRGWPHVPGNNAIVIAPVAPSA